MKKEEQKPLWSEILNVLGLVSLTFYSMVGIALTLSVLISHIPCKYFFTEQYITAKKAMIEVKYVAMKDSSMKYVNEPIKYNRYVDSANKYVTIYNSFNLKIK